MWNHVHFSDIFVHSNTWYFWMTSKGERTRYDRNPCSYYQVDNENNSTFSRSVYSTRGSRARSIFGSMGAGGVNKYPVSPHTQHIYGKAKNKLR